MNQIRHGNTQQRYLCACLISTGKLFIEGKLEILRSRHIMTTKFRSHCCFCVRHEKRTDKLSVRQQSIYCVKNARNALSRKHWTNVGKQCGPNRHYKCRLLIAFANKLDPDQVRSKVVPDLDPNCLTLLWNS